MKAKVLYRVPYADTDQMAVVYYANYLVYFERARNELLRELGVPYKDFEIQGIMLPVLEANCEYFKPAKYDDLLEIYAWVSELKGPRIKISCEVKKENDVLATGHTTHAFMSSEKRKPVRPPKEILKKLSL